jgi:hypothetical protein
MATQEGNDTVDNSTLYADTSVTNDEYNKAVSINAMLTTYDNPYNPYTDYDAWWQWDRDNGYNTPELLAFVMGDTSNALDEVEVAQIQATAMNYIVDEGPIEDVWTFI